MMILVGKDSSNCDSRKSTSTELEAVHATEEENEDEIVKSEEEIGEHEGDEKINESEKQEGDKFGGEDPICAPCEDPDSIDADVDLEAEVQRAATDPGQPTQAQRDENNLPHLPSR